MKGNEVENLLRDMQQYRELTDRLKAIYGDQMTLKDMVDVMERIIREPGKKDPVNARILTYDEAAMWDEYRKIGTPEELKAESKYLRLVKKHGTVGKAIEACAEYEGIGTVEECRAAMKKKPEKPMAELEVFGEPEEKDLDRLKSLHHKILYSKIAEIVTEQEMIAFLRAQNALKKQLSECPFLNSGGNFYE